MSIRVVIADDHNVVRKRIRDLLSDEDDIAVVGEARNGQEAVDLATALLPDVVVMDIAMPEMTGVEATREIRAQAPGVRVLCSPPMRTTPTSMDCLTLGRVATSSTAVARKDQK